MHMKTGIVKKHKSTTNKISKMIIERIFRSLFELFIYNNCIIFVFALKRRTFLSQINFAPRLLRWEFIKENKKVRKQELDQESDQEKK